MKKVGNTRVLVCILGFLSLLYAQQRPSVNSPSCVQTAPTRIYSNAFAHEETGDILGYELAIKENKDSAADILLYVYEGAPDDEGIPLSGRLSGKRLIAQGKWVEHLVQYPEKTEVVQTRSVKVEGTLDTASFNGQIRIESMESADRVRLKRVKKLWFCKRQNERLTAVLSVAIAWVIFSKWLSAQYLERDDMPIKSQTLGYGLGYGNP